MLFITSNPPIPSTPHSQLEWLYIYVAFVQCPLPETRGLYAPTVMVFLINWQYFTIKDL